MTSALCFWSLTFHLSGSPNGVKEVSLSATNGPNAPNILISPPSPLSSLWTVLRKQDIKHFFSLNFFPQTYLYFFFS